MSEPSQVLVALLRLGERSAEAAFERLARGDWCRGPVEHRAQLLSVARDERRHEVALSALQLGSPAPLTGAARRFFLGLRHRDHRVHLARIAALDGCVCQIITAVLRPAPSPRIPPALRAVLSGIRSDEARHVRVTRNAALQSGASRSLLLEWDLQTRADFTAVLGVHAPELAALGVDGGALLRSIDRGPG